MIAVLGGLDVLVFTGGVGEHAPEVRAAACERLGFAGVRLDADRNAVIDRGGRDQRARRGGRGRSWSRAARTSRSPARSRGVVGPACVDPAPTSLARRFEAVMFDWDGTAVTDRKADAGAVRDVGRAAVRVRRRCRDRERHAPRERRRPAPRASPRARAAAAGAQSRLGALRGRRRTVRGSSAPARRHADEDAALDAGRGADRRAARRARPRGAHRVAAAEPAEDRPDPAPRVGRPAQGARSIGCSPPSSSGCATPGIRDLAEVADARDRRRAGGRTRRSPGHERRQARRDRAHRQDRFGARGASRSSGPTASRRSRC